MPSPFIRFSLLLWLCLTSITSLAAPPPLVPIDVAKGLFALSTPKMIILEPANIRYIQERLHERMSLEDVSQIDEQQWQRLKLRSLSFGRGTHPVWVHFAVHNHSSLLQEQLLELRWTNMHKVNFYSVPRLANGELNLNEAIGHAVGLEADPQTNGQTGPSHLFPLRIDAQSQLDVFIRIESDYLLFTPLYLWPEEQFATYEQSYIGVHALLFGMFLSLLMYNMLITLVTRDITFVYYTAYLASSILYLLSVSGIGNYLIWKDSTWITVHAYPLSIYLSMFFGTLFARHFLKLEEVGQWYLGVNQAFAWYWGLTFLIVSVGISPKGFATDLMALASVSTSLFYGVILWKKGHPQARLFTLAWSGLIITAIINILMLKGIVSYSPMNQYAMIIGFLLEVMILALALAQQMNREKILRQQAQQELLHVEQENNRKLEGMVAERTRELEQLTRTLSHSNRELEHLSQVDALTGLANRRTFDATLEKELRRCNRTRTQLSLIMVDADHFKRINDNHGHSTGDLCLQEMARRLTSHFSRSGDCISRYGGEEFALILAGTHPEDAVHRAEAFRRQLESSPIKAGNLTLKMTVSLGVSGGIPDINETPTGWINASDEALYEAKGAGRNQTVLATRNEPPEQVIAEA